jgi:uncharacterized protein (DUF488 family)
VREEAAKHAPVLYTLGHSRHALGNFIALLEKHAIVLVVDVRGQPYSRYNPQFNRESLEQSLRAKGIDYTWRGEHLSGRPKQPEFYAANGEVLWERLAESPALLTALDELREECCARRLALVCAEEDPNRCHRRFLLTPPLITRGIEVLHVRGDGRLEDERSIRAGEKRSEATRQRDLFD